MTRGDTSLLRFSGRGQEWFDWRKEILFLGPGAGGGHLKAQSLDVGHEGSKCRTDGSGNAWDRSGTFQAWSTASMKLKDQAGGLGVCS